MKSDCILIVLILLLCNAVSFGGLVVDQAQESAMVAPVIPSDSVLALWQEFTPDYDNVSQIDLRIYRDTRVKYGDIAVMIKDGSENVIWSDTVPDTSIPSLFSWITISTISPVPVVPGQIYKIELTSQSDGWQLNWMGRENSSYTAGVSDHGANFDYAFRTYAEVIPEPVTIALLSAGAVLLRRKKTSRMK